MKTLLFLLTLVLVTCPVFANDEGLYDPVAPENSSFIRVVNIDSGSAEMTLGPKKAAIPEPGAATPYYVAKAGENVIQSGEKSLGLNLKEGEFYSIVIGKDKIISIEDQKPESPSKAVISLYNFSDFPSLHLKASGGKIPVLENVAAGQAGFRNINGVKVELAVFNEEKAVADLGEVSLSRGAAYTIFVITKDNITKALLIRAVTDTNK